MQSICKCINANAYKIGALYVLLLLVIVFPLLLFLSIVGLCTGVPAVPSPFTFSKPYLCTFVSAVRASPPFPGSSTPLLLRPHSHPCPPPSLISRPRRDRVKQQLSQLQQHPRHRLLQDPLKAQPHKVHHMDDQLALLARLPGHLCPAWPGGSGESAEACFSSTLHCDHIQVI